MGAIYGLIGNSNAANLSAMGARLKHRGKITKEWAFSQKVRMGERLHGVGTNQLVNDKLAVVADADISNACELRERLISCGRSFESERPDEVILQGYAEFGPKVCEFLKGDFAFALWDADRSILVLARDALGSRPIYYWKGKGLFTFASEYKALLALPFVPVEADLEAVQQLQYTKYPPAHGTLLQDIRSVPAGNVFEYNLLGKCEARRYWTIKLDLLTTPESEQVQAVREQFLATIRRQVGDLEVIGATLSGGIDSAAIAAAIRKVRPDITLHTFTCGYGPEDPEMKMAAIVAEQVGAIHHPLVIKPGDIPRLMPQVVWHLEDPIARSETVLNFETARYAAEYVDVVLAGYVSDGLYGGMPKHKIIKLIQWMPWLKTPLEEFYNYTQYSVKPKSIAGRLLQQAYFRGGDSAPLNVNGGIAPPETQPLPEVKEEFLNQVLLSGVVNGVPKWLPKVDRLHFAHGLNYRSPYTDVDLIHNAFQISDRYKIRRWREKHIFREAVRSFLPPVVLNRPKFPQAMKYDLALTEVLEKISHQVLSAEAIRARGFFKVSDVERIRKRSAQKTYSSEQSMRLWTAILTELWAQIFIDHRGEMVQL